MQKAIFISIRRPVPTEGGRRATIQAFALHTPVGRPSVLTVAAPRPVLTPQPFTDAFQAVDLAREGK